MKTLNKIAATTLATSFLFANSSTWAVNVTDNLDISITIQAACTLNGLDDIAATHLQGASGNQAQSGTVRVTCNSGTAYKIGMGSGSNLIKTYQRRVRSGSNYINYDLVIPTSGNAWGTKGMTSDTSLNDSNAVSGTGTGVQQSFGYQVKYALSGTEAAGVYSDTVLVTLEF